MAVAPLEATSMLPTGLAADGMTLMTSDPVPKLIVVGPFTAVTSMVSAPAFALRTANM